MFIHRTPVHTLILINPKLMNFGYDMVHVYRNFLLRFLFSMVYIRQQHNTFNNKLTRIFVN